MEIKLKKEKLKMLHDLFDTAISLNKLCDILKNSIITILSPKGP